MATMEEMLGVGQVAEVLGVSRYRVHQLIGKGTIPAEMVAGRYLVRRGDLDRPAVRDRKPGRPKKPD